MMSKEDGTIKNMDPTTQGIFSILISQLKKQNYYEHITEFNSQTQGVIRVAFPKK